MLPLILKPFTQLVVREQTCAIGYSWAKCPLELNQYAAIQHLYCATESKAIQKQSSLPRCFVMKKCLLLLVL